MIDFLKKTWWKWICSVLLVYVLLAGMLIPLGAGITSISPFVFKADSLYTFTVKGYNTHFSGQNNTQVWLKAEQQFFCPQKVEVVDANTLKVQFGISSKLSKPLMDNNYDIIVNNTQDGTIALREGLTLVKGEVAVADSLLPKTNNCKVEVANNKSSAFAFPFREILYESVRNTFYHVPMWFTMLVLILLSTYFSVRYLQTGNLQNDTLAAAFGNVALTFGLLGIFTGMIWATYTWGEPWPNDPKLNGAAIGIMIYLAYSILRGSVNDEIKRARLAAVYSIFAAVIFILFIFVVPRLPETDSLHPGNGGNPAFSKYDLDSRLRMVFYPAVIAWILLGIWISGIVARINLLKNRNA
jgi:heme exporter protein C